ncbi:MAG TPA: CinA family protein [Rickettsiales bacterium]|nr:CinA family protein [Rickettsiales bacterium]
MFSDSLITQAQALLTQCRKNGFLLVTAESCTGGLIAALLTEIPGSSSVFERGFVTYSNAAKIAQLGVPEALLAEHGAVSAQVAQAMAQGALANSHASLSVSVTGIAGPDGGTADKPVGLVYIAVGMQKGGMFVKEFRFEGDRRQVRLATVAEALALLMDAAGRKQS